MKNAIHFTIHKSMKNAIYFTIHIIYQKYYIYYKNHQENQF